VDILLTDPEKANLLAIFLHRMLARSTAKPLTGTVQLRVGRMVARVAFDTEPRVESGEGPADVEIAGSLATFLRAATRGGAVWAWLRGRVRTRGNPLRALAFLKGVRCTS
jgi:hypothetical protein